MKIAVTGAAGLFGHALVGTFRVRHEVLPLARPDADITDKQQVEEVLLSLKPETIVHPAGIPDLDICEADPELAYRVNVEGTRHIVEAARQLKASVAYISTDAVYEGEKRTPYKESDSTNPPTIYGKTKLEAEKIITTVPEHWIFRVSVLFGPGKANFVEKGLRKLAAGEEYTVAADQVSSATYTLDAARTILPLIEARRYGLFHLSNQGVCSRLDLAQAAGELAGLDPRRVIGKPADQMGRRAKRLKYAVMDLDGLERAGVPLPRPWREALADYVHLLSSIANAPA